MEKSFRTVALIPARSGSERIKNKNIQLLDGHPLLAYTIRAAIDSNIFDEVIVATDSEQYSEIARYYGASTPYHRPSELSGALSPDFEWVRWVLDALANDGEEFDIFSILRPTSPFRLATTIQRAWDEFSSFREIDSIRAVQKCAEHPGKMWILGKNNMTPLLPFNVNGTPWHSNQYKSLPEVYVQNASLEIAWSRVLTEFRSIAGEQIAPFVTSEHEGFDINNEVDMYLAQKFVRDGMATLPEVLMEPYKSVKAKNNG